MAFPAKADTTAASSISTVMAETAPPAVVGADTRASPTLTTPAWSSTASSTGSTSNEGDSDGNGDGDGDDDVVPNIRLNTRLSAERLTGGFGPEDGPSFMSAAESETIVRIMQQYLPAVKSKREASE